MLRHTIHYFVPNRSYNINDQPGNIIIVVLGTAMVLFGNSLTVHQCLLIRQGLRQACCSDACN